MPNAELWVDKDVFADEMRALRAAGYTAITLQQAWDGWKHGGPLPKHRSCVSFDDGYLSHYTHAKPVLRELGWPGVLNLEIKSIGPGGLTEHQIRSLMNAGWEIDSHTLTHPDLTTLDDAALRTSSGSRRELRRAVRRARGLLRLSGRALRRRVGRHQGRRLHGGDHGRARASPPGATTRSRSSVCG